MLSLSKLLAGRKRDSAVWEFFTYDQTTGKSTCNVVEKFSTTLHDDFPVVFWTLINNIKLKKVKLKLRTTQELKVGTEII